MFTVIPKLFDDVAKAPTNPSAGGTTTGYPQYRSLKEFEDCPVLINSSPEGAKLLSPDRKVWERFEKYDKPRRGDTDFVDHHGSRNR